MLFLWPLLCAHLYFHCGTETSVYSYNPETNFILKIRIKSREPNPVSRGWVELGVRKLCICDLLLVMVILFTMCGSSSHLLLKFCLRRSPFLFFLHLQGTTPWMSDDLTRLLRACWLRACLLGRLLFAHYLHMTLLTADDSQLKVCVIQGRFRHGAASACESGNGLCMCYGTKRATQMLIIIKWCNLVYLVMKVIACTCYMHMTEHTHCLWAQETFSVVYDCTLSMFVCVIHNLCY